MVFLDYETDGDVDVITRPLSHAGLIKLYLEGGGRRKTCKKLPFAWTPDPKIGLFWSGSIPGSFSWFLRLAMGDRRLLLPEISMPCRLDCRYEGKSSSRFENRLPVSE